MVVPFSLSLYVFSLVRWQLILMMWPDDDDMANSEMIDRGYLKRSFKVAEDLKQNI